MMTMIVPVALAIAAALVYLASSNAKVCELARLVFFASVLVVAWMLAGDRVHL